jgi:hypothetical protein
MRRGLRASALAVVVTLAPIVTTACGTAEAGAAAVVGERRITVADLQQATTQVQTFADAQAGGAGTQQVEQRSVLTFLVLAPYLVDQAQRAGVGVSPDDARQVVRATLTQPAPSTVEFFRANLALQRIQGLGQERGQAALQEVADQARAAAPEVNPRYGEWVWDGRNDPIAGARQNWIVPSPSPSPSAQPGEGGQPGEGEGEPPAEGGEPGESPAPEVSPTS